MKPLKLGMKWPLGKKFAFTVFDDTDLSVCGNFEKVYEFLHQCGLKTTKSVWPIRAPGKPYIGGATLEDEAYLAEIKKIQALGFEIAYHNSSYLGVPRSEISRGLELFQKNFGHYPTAMSNHANSREAIYWGSSRLSGFEKMIYQVLTTGRDHRNFYGHIPGHENFWGDLCLEKINYVRNFTTSEINTLKQFPFMPYHDPARPFVKAWFASTEGPNVHAFNDCTQENSIDGLEREGGACIMYTHFANGFQQHGEVNAQFKKQMESLSKREGWFVPVSTLLDYLKTQPSMQNQAHELKTAERKKMERDWLRFKISIGGSS
jgi:hypothetical protein